MLPSAGFGAIRGAPGAQRVPGWSAKAVASGRTRASDARTSCMCWDPMGPVGIAPLVGLLRAVLARPCGQRVAFRSLR